MLPSPRQGIAGRLTAAVLLSCLWEITCIRVEEADIVNAEQPVLEEDGEPVSGNATAPGSGNDTEPEPGDRFVGELTPESAGVACDPLVYWLRSWRDAAPAEVDKMIDEHAVKTEFLGLLADINNLPKRFLSKWNITGIYALIQEDTRQEAFISKGLNLVLRYKPNPVGGRVSICFIDLSVNARTGSWIDHEFRDAKTPFGEQLPRGVVSVWLGTCRTDRKENMLDGVNHVPQTTDLDSMIRKKELEVTHDKLLKQIREDLANTKDLGCNNLALKFLDYTRRLEGEFMAQGIRLLANYEVRQVLPQVIKFNLTDRYEFWAEYVDLNERPEYESPHQILPSSACERMHSPRTGKSQFPSTSLAIQAILNLHDLVEQHEDLRIAVTETPQATDSGWDIEAVYSAIWDFEKRFNRRGVSLYLTQAQQTRRWGGALLVPRICYLDQSSPFAEAPTDTFHDGTTIFLPFAEQLGLPKGVFGESLRQVHGRVVFNDDTPIDIRRLLRIHDGEELHKKLIDQVKEVPPSRNGKPAYPVYLVVENYQKQFNEKGLRVFVCSRVQKFNYEGFTGFRWDSWVEYVDLDKMMDPAYEPADSLSGQAPKPGGGGGSTPEGDDLGQKDKGSASSLRVSAVLLSIFAFILLTP